MGSKHSIVVTFGNKEILNLESLNLKRTTDFLWRNIGLGLSSAKELSSLSHKQLG